MVRSISGFSITIRGCGLTVWLMGLSSENPTVGSQPSSTGLSSKSGEFYFVSNCHLRFCPLFPFQSIKTVRLRLSLTQPLVEDLNVRVLLLVRDPRGTMESRKHRDWCPGNKDCEDPARLCQDLQSDYESFQTLSQQFPGRYK